MARIPRGLKKERGEPREVLRHAYDRMSGRWIDCNTARKQCTNPDHIVHVDDSDKWREAARGMVGWMNVRKSDGAATTVGVAGLDDDFVQIARVFDDQSANNAKAALREVGINFRQTFSTEGSQGQFKMTEFHVAPKDYERAHTIVDEAVNL